jgi:hypothetical protein
VATLDSWGLIVRKQSGGEGALRGDSTAYFLTFHLIVSFTLIPVVVAVLIENFTLATKREKDNHLIEMHRELEKQTGAMRKVQLSLDPLIKTLLGASSRDELSLLIASTFRKLDSDRSGSLSYSELRLGLKKMDFTPPILLSEEEFDRITLNKMLCNEEQEVDQEGWENILRTQLLSYW